ncbi:MAG TPA: DegT/DnrJ/EryC1/StrS aminotransferase family protein [Humisphaera sp.]|jgi:perosamine synthetase|nr:DegT/DnrJ/EryC1/StrS aminotransferase family protein [Humisphaera sp.]
MKTMKLQSRKLEPIPWARPAIDDAELREVVACMNSGWLTSGPRVERFEQEMAKRAWRQHAVAVSNGTAALDLALRVAGIRTGDEVIVPAFSYVATASAVALQGATPVFADIERRNLGLDPSSAESCLSSRTRAILCTDYGGNPCDYAKLTALAERHQLPLIVDGAQSIGSILDGRPALSYGLISTTSFHAAKTMTTVEGGMVFTDDPALARRMRIIRSQGEDPQRKYYHIELGHNFRMTELQAAIGLAQLTKLDALLESRQTLAGRYRAAFAPLGLPMPSTIAGALNSYFLFPLLVPQRDEIVARLKLQMIDTRVCYPLPLYSQPIFQSEHKPFCPVTEEACRQILNPPMFFGLSADQQKRVGDALRAALDELAPAEWRKAV